MTDQAAMLLSKSQTASRNLAPYGLVCQLRAMLAVAWRELLTFIRYPSWIVAIFIWPVLLPLQYIFGARALAGPDRSGLGIFAGYTGTTDYIGYIALGGMLWMWMNMVLWSFGTYLRNEQVRGTLESNWLSPMPRILMLAGAGISNALQNTFVIALSLLEYYLFMGVGMKGSPVLVFLIILLTIPTVYGIGLIFASLVIWAKEVNTMVFLVRGVMMIFCGISFPLTVAPVWMQKVAEWIPMTHSIRAFRQVYLNGAGFSAVRGDLLTLALFGLLLTVIGIGAFQWTSRIVQRKGTIGVY